MQVKKDISEGRLNAPMTSTILLSSFVVQSTIGDYDPDTCGVRLPHTLLRPKKTFN